MPPSPPFAVRLKTIPVPVQALVDAGLSPTQWVMLYLIHFKCWDELTAILSSPNKQQLYTNDDLDDLHSRFYLIYEPIPGPNAKTHPANFRCSERFTDLLPLLDDKAIYLPVLQPYSFQGPDPSMSQKEYVKNIDALEYFDELFAAYPSHIMVKDQMMSGRGGDYDVMAASYAKALSAKSSPDHATILDLVGWARQQNLLTMGLKKFLDSREWLGLQELRDQGFAGSTFDSQTAI